MWGEAFAPTHFQYRPEAGRLELAETKDELRVLGHLVRGPRRVPRELGLDLLDAGHRLDDLFDRLLDQRAGRAAHRGQAVAHVHALAGDRDVVEQAELDDVHSKLGVLDGAERLDYVIACRHQAVQGIEAGRRRGARPTARGNR